MEWVKKKLSKYKSVLSSGFSILANIAGIVIGIIGLKSDQLSNTVVFWTLLISFATVFLCSVFTTLYYVYTKAVVEKQKQDNAEVINKLNKKNDELNDTNKRISMGKDTYIKNISQFIKNINYTLNAQQVILYIEVERHLSELDYDRELFASIETEQAEVYERILGKKFKEQREYFEKAIYDKYNRFIARMIKESKSILECHINCKGYDLKVSVTLKMLNEPVSDIDDFRNADAFVYTAFRDEVAYNEKKREIAQATYSIHGNTDFTQCLKKESYIRNNVQRSDEDYLNEHTDFDQYYNCTITVPVIYGTAPNRTLFAYLCCDALNTEAYAGMEIFDKRAAHLLFAVAANIGVFINQAYCAWDEPFSINGNFTTYVYNVLSEKYKFENEVIS